MIKLVFLIGIPCVGKSTWIKNQNFESNVVVISPDNLRMKYGKDISDQSVNSTVWIVAEQQIVEALNNGKHVVLDATNVRAKNRRKLLASIKSAIKPEILQQIQTVAFVFPCDPAESKRRIANDLANGLNRSNVPEHVIDQMAQSFVSGLTSIPSEFDVVVQI